MKKNRDSVSEQNPRYERYKPEMYNDRVPIFWWMRKKSYVLFILRELTSLCVAAYAVILIYQLSAISRGLEAYESFIAFLASPFSVGLHIFIFVATFFHSITWFKLAPSAMVLKVGKKRIPDNVIIAANFLMWIVLSLIIAWLLISI